MSEGMVLSSFGNFSNTLSVFGGKERGRAVLEDSRGTEWRTGILFGRQDAAVEILRRKELSSR
jgi:hypothetical protein